MYESHFQLQDRPFASAPNPEHYFPASSIEQAREVMALNVDRAAGATMVVGGVGSGKTLLCQLIANQFASELPVCITNGSQLHSREHLMHCVMDTLGLPVSEHDESRLRLILSNHISGLACYKGILLIIDEADRLSEDLLEEVRAWTNLVAEGEPRVRLILAGTHRLEEAVATPSLESLNQRIVGRLYLENFTLEEAVDYIRARITASGGDVAKVFTTDAMEMVYRATHGVPRLVNQTCDHALMMAAVGKFDQIDGQLVEEAWADLQQIPLPSDGFTRAASHPAANVSGEDVVEFASLDEEESFNEVVTHEKFEQPEEQVITMDAAALDSELSSGFEERLEVSFETGDVSAVDVAEVISSDADNAIDLVPREEVWAGETAVELPRHLVQFDAPAFADASEEKGPAANDVGVTPKGQSDDANEPRTSTAEDLTMAHVTSPFGDGDSDVPVSITNFASPGDFARADHEQVTSNYSKHLAEQLTMAHPGLKMHAEGEMSEDIAMHDQFEPLSNFLAIDDEEVNDEESTPMTLRIAAEFDDFSDDPVMPDDGVDEALLVATRSADGITSDAPDQEDTFSAIRFHQEVPQKLHKKKVFASLFSEMRKRA